MLDALEAHANRLLFPSQVKSSGLQKLLDLVYKHEQTRLLELAASPSPQGETPLVGAAAQPQGEPEPHSNGVVPGDAEGAGVSPSSPPEGVATSADGDPPACEPIDQYRTSP